MIKVLGLALYSPLAASTRYRLSQYIPGLERLGIDLHIRYLLGDEYLQARFSGKAMPIKTMLCDSFSRLEDLWRQKEYDIIILQSELMPLIPGWLERAMMQRPYIYDFDDALYLKYRSGKLRLTSPLLGTKFNTIIKGAAAITAGNSTLVKYAGVYNENTRYLPTVVDTNRYVPQPSKRGGKVFTIGWIGSPSTAPYLTNLVLPLSEIGKEGPVRLVVIGGKAPTVSNVSVVECEWNEDTEIDLINSFDVGVMPLPDNEWARGKCAFKLIQYMACSIPVIASPIGANIELVRSDCGLLASTTGEWIEAFRILRNQPDTRLKMGKESRLRIETHYSLQQNLSVLANVIFEVARIAK